MALARLDDGRQVFPDKRDTYSLQRVIGAKFDYHYTWLVPIEQLSNSPFATGSGFAAHAGIDDREVFLLGGKPGPQQIDPSSAPGQSVTRRETIAED